MRCSCTVCDTYMVHAESMALGCVCPECGNRCTACLGTNTVISREALRSWRQDPVMERMVIEKIETDEAAADEAQQADRPWKDDDKWRG